MVQGGVSRGPKLAVVFFVLVAAVGAAVWVGHWAGIPPGASDVGRATLAISGLSNYTTDVVVKVLINGGVRRTGVTIPGKGLVTMNETVAFPRATGAYFLVELRGSGGEGSSALVLVNSTGVKAIRLFLDPSPGPNILLGTPTTTAAYEFRIPVQFIARAEALGRYRAAVLNGTDSLTPVGPVDVAEGPLGSGGGIALALSDVDGDGNLSTGDYFTVDGIRDPYTYQLVVLWKASGSTLVSATLAAPTFPNVAFLTPYSTTNPYEFKLEVGSVSQAVPLDYFQVSLMNASSTLSILPRVVLQSGTLGTGGGVTLTFTDLNGDGRLGGGDFFILQGIKWSYHYILKLWWKTGGALVTDASVG